MGLVTGFLLWVTEILAVKWVRREKNTFRKIVKAVAFLIVGVVLVMMFFVLISN